MKIDDKKKNEILDSIRNAQDKPEAIYDAIAEMNAQANAELIDQIMTQAEKDKAQNLKDEARGFRPLTANETKFYEKLKAGPAQMAVTADQIDIIPTETVDYTLNEIKQASGVTNLITFTPANVKKWLFGSKTGAAAWGNLTDALTAELTATITSLNMDVFKLSAYVVIPKSIRELEIGYVDRYVTAVLSEAMQDGIVNAYLYGDGKKAPIGITKQIDATTTTGAAKDKTAITIKSFSPKDMAAALKTLSHGGLRTVSSVAIIANPADVYDYINPALYADSIVAGYAQKSVVPVTVYADANAAQGKAVMTMPGLYTMGFQGVQVTEYKETKALDDADVIIAKVYGNGRAVDNDAAVVFDPTKLEEYKLPEHKTTATA